LPLDFQWASIADPKAMTVIYMPKKTIGEFVTRAMENSLAADTPAVAVARATRPDERVIVSTLSKLPEVLTGESGPLLVLVGQALADYDSVAVTDAVAEAARLTRAAD
jgi:uroporphyrin-III C-methyltransferase/precorrin-2 dehydrogenase/sirohydrochlorin ferrochelatase